MGDESEIPDKMEEPEDKLIPLSPSLTFLYSSNPICSIPVFVLDLLVREANVSPGDDRLLQDLLGWADRIIAGERGFKDPKIYVEFFRKTLAWQVLAQYLSIPTYFGDAIAEMWSGGDLPHGPFSLRLDLVRPPDTLYRYMQFDPARTQELLKDGKLFMPCPAKFNDPFDCSLDEPTRLTFIERAIGCFSTVRDDVLMFSHYADNHRGLCVGFDTQKLLNSLSAKNPPLRADLRPVWYFTKMPPLSHVTQPALCATCKHDIWRYEQEFRIFMVRGKSLAPSGMFTFDREALSEVIYGCKATDDTVRTCKTLTDDLSSCQQKKAFQLPNQFGIQLHTIHKV